MARAQDSELLANEKLSLDALRDLQLLRLKDTISHAWTNNPHFRKKCDLSAVRPDDLRDLKDLAKFPLSSKSDLRESYPFGYFSVPIEDVARIHASSGTTGKPTVVGYTEADLRTWSGLVARSIYAAGGRPGMKVHIAYGYGLFTGGLGAHYGAEALGCTVIPMSGGQTARQIQLINDFRPDIIMSTPSYMLTILDEMKAQGIDSAATSLKIGIFGAEPWSEAMRREIETSAQITAVDIYGLSEVMGPGVAQEYGATKDGVTIWEDHFFPEIVDPETGQALEDGLDGELVFTSLTKQAMPVVRYRTRDLTRLLPGSVGPMRRMARIIGRSDDMLIVRGVNVFPGQIEEQILKFPAFAPHYEIVVSRPDRLDLVDLKVETRSTMPIAERDNVAASLAHSIKVNVGISVNVAIRPVGSLKRFEGKSKRVTDIR